jgi:hypothetical protein
LRILALPKKHGQALKGMPGAVLWLLKFPPVAVKSIMQHAKAHILKKSVNSADRLSKSQYIVHASSNLQSVFPLKRKNAL